MIAPGQPADLPELEALKVQAYAYITAWLEKDFWTIARIAHELGAAYGEDGGPVADAAQQVAEVFSLAGAALLTDALDGRRADAAALAAGRLDVEATAQARRLAGLAAEAA